MKRTYAKWITILLTVLLTLSLAGCGQLAQLKQYLPGGQGGEDTVQTGEAEEEPVSGDLSELQGSLKWVYLIGETGEKGDSPTGILVCNPSLSGRAASGLSGIEVYIDWDGREFDLEAAPSQSAEGWYYSAELAMNIRNENFVLRVYLLRDGEEAEEIRLENPKLSVLSWPALTAKDGIRMEKSGGSYTFSAKTLGDLFEEPVSGVFSYRIRDCQDCNVQLEGDTLRYKSISDKKKATFIVEITDPAGKTKETRVGISWRADLKLILTAAGIAASLVAAAAAFILLRRVKGRGREKEEAVAAQQDILELAAQAQSLLDQCRELSARAGSVREDALRQSGIYGSSLISRDVIESATDEAEDIENTPAFETLRIDVSDLELMGGMLADGKKAPLRHRNWTRESFLKAESRKKELDEVRRNMEELKEVLDRANDEMSHLSSITNPGKEPFGFAFDIWIREEGMHWFCRIDQEMKGSQRLGDLFFRNENNELACGDDILGGAAAQIRIISLDEEKILISSKDSILRETGRLQAGREDENSIWMRRGTSRVFTAGDEKETVEIISE